MKKIKIFLLAIVLVLTAACLTACGDGPSVFAKKYTVSFDTRGGSEVAELKLKDGMAVSLPEAPEKEGHNFICWEDSAGKQVENGTVLEAADITLYAKWEPITYKISFNTRGGSSVAPISLKYGETLGNTVSMPAAPTKEGWNWIAWEDKSGKKFVLGDTFDYKDTTLYAVWEQKTYTISFDTRGGSTVSPLTLKWGDSMGGSAAMPVQPARQGYDFLGWLKPDGSAFTPGDTLGYQNTTLFANWRERTFTVSFDSLDGSKVDPVVVKEGAKLKLPADPTLTNFAFAGWLDASQNLVEDEALSIYQDITLRARWRRTHYTISFDTRGGNALDPITLPVGEYLGEKFSAPIVLDIPGYTFGGWEDKDGKLITDISKLPKEEQTLYVRWTKTFTISFDSRGGSAVAPITCTDGVEIVFTDSEKPTLANHEFICWEDKHGTPILDGALLAPDNIMLYAKWNRVAYTVYFDARGGKEVAPQTLSMDEWVGQYSQIPFSLKDGYDFYGWEDTAGNIIENWQAVPREDQTVYARWVKNYTISFDSRGGSAVEPITFVEGQTITFPSYAVPTKSGYRFVCWETKSGMPILDGALLAPEDLILYAKWEEAEPAG